MIRGKIAESAFPEQRCQRLKRSIRRNYSWPAFNLTAQFQRNISSKISFGDAVLCMEKNFLFLSVPHRSDNQGVPADYISFPHTGVLWYAIWWSCFHWTEAPSCLRRETSYGSWWDEAGCKTDGHRKDARRMWSAYDICVRHFWSDGGVCNVMSQQKEKGGAEGNCSATYLDKSLNTCSVHHCIKIVPLSGATRTTASIWTASTTVQKRFHRRFAVHTSLSYM